MYIARLHTSQRAEHYRVDGLSFCEVVYQAYVGGRVVYQLSRVHGDPSRTAHHRIRSFPLNAQLNVHVHSHPLGMITKRAVV